MARGTIHAGGAFFVFSLTGYVIHFALARLLSARSYGEFGVVLSVAGVLQLFIMRGLPDAAARDLAQQADGRQVLRRALLLQTIVATVVALLVIVAAPRLAAILRGGDLVMPLRFLGVLVFARSYEVLYGHFFTGYRQFGRAATMVLINSAFRFVCVLAGVALGFGVVGALSGYAVGSVASLVYGVALFRPVGGRRATPLPQLLRFGVPIICFSLFFQLMLALDILFVKSFASDQAVVGYYTSARIIATAFAVVAIAFSATLLPSVSASDAHRDEVQTRAYITTSLRYVLMLFVPAAVVVASTSHPLLSLLFRPEYARAGNALSLLAFAWLFLQGFYILGAIINASGHSRTPLLISGVGVLIAGVLDWFMVRRYGMEGAALATLISGATCFVVGLYSVHRIYGASIDFMSTGRIIAASGAILLVSCLVSISGVGLLPLYVVLFSGYLVILLALGEITPKDWTLVRELVASFLGSGKM
ncbi:MAG: oligosaccharide flippase family protein [Planctomycetes bacterium]|nr:oligosaccharide flippase family protein [Planctomycetota bacterium]